MLRAQVLCFRELFVLRSLFCSSVMDGSSSTSPPCPLQLAFLRTLGLMVALLLVGGQGAASYRAEATSGVTEELQ